MKLAAEIPAYLPDGFYWSKLILSDIFLLEDRLFFPKHGPAHRVKLQGEKEYLTIPCHFTKNQPIYAVQTDSDIYWQKTHWATITTRYSHLPFSGYLLDELKPLYEEWSKQLSPFLFRIIQYIKYLWRIPTQIVLSSEKFGTQIPDLYVCEWYQYFQPESLLVWENEIPFLQKHCLAEKVPVNILQVNDQGFQEELTHNTLYLLFTYGTDFPALVRKNVVLKERIFL